MAQILLFDQRIERMGGKDDVEVAFTYLHAIL